MRLPGVRTYAMAFALIAIWAMFAFFTDGVFLSARNLANLARQASVTAILATAMVLVIVSANIDLSVGSLSGFLGACVAVLHAQWGWAAAASLLSVVVVGWLLGMCHGVLIAYLRVPAFIVTLGGMMVYRGAMLAATRGETIRLPEGSWLRALAQGGVGGVVPGVGLYVDVPVPLIAVALLAGLFAFVASRTRFGRHVYAVGGNVEAAYLSGIETRRTVLWVFALMGAMCGVAGSLLTARVASASPEAGRLLELDAIAACVIGGSSLMGGRGGIPGALLGALIMESLNNGMSLANMGVFWQDTVRGSVLVLAVLFDVRVRQRG
jgi:D-xylose transport system permease protein